MSTTSAANLYGARFTITSKENDQLTIMGEWCNGGMLYASVDFQARAAGEYYIAKLHRNRFDVYGCETAAAVSLSVYYTAVIAAVRLSLICLSSNTGVSPRLCTLVGSV